MTPDTEALGRRAVACEGWRWMPGMRSVSPGGHSRRLDPPPNATGLHPWWTWSEGECEEGLPDLSDPCTLGGLLALVREAWATPIAWVEPGHDGLWVMCIYVNGECRLLESYDSEAEALVAALEAAP